MLDRPQSRTGTGWTHITDLNTGDKYTRSATTAIELTVMRSGITTNDDGR